MVDYKSEVYERAKIKVNRYCPTETLYIGTLGDLFKTTFVQVLIGLTLVLFVIGALLDFFYRRKQAKQQRDGDKAVDEEEMIVRTSFDDEKKNGQFM